MIKITKATKKEALNKDWNDFIDLHYGQGLEWVEKSFRFKAVEDGKLVGTIDGKYESGTVYIAALMVTPSVRKQGVGMKLIARAEMFGKELGAHRTWLMTGKDWEVNHYYQKLGFKLIGALPDFYFHKDFVIYTREIE